MDEIYIEEFSVSKFLFEDNRDVRNRALREVNDFFNKKATGYKVLNIIEEWSENKTCLRLIIYYY